MAEKGRTISFIDNETGGPIATLRGKQADWLFKHSELIRILVENEPTKKHYEVPVSFPSDRVGIFRKLLKELPVGTERKETIYSTGGIEYDPLGPLEEANIQREIAAGKLRSTNLYVERQRVILEVLSFLMLDPEVEEEMIILRKENNSSEKEQVRRNRISRTRGKNHQHPYLNEDTIEGLVRNHKNLLYMTYKGQPGLQKFLRTENINARNKRQENFNTRILKARAAMSRSRGTRRFPRRIFRNSNSNNFNNYNNNNNNNNNNFNNMDMYNIQGPFNNSNFPTHWFTNVDLTTMTSIEFERYLRSKMRKGNELGTLPYQGNPNLNRVFNGE